MDSIELPVRVITWSDYDDKTPILLQDQNGPCPLIALMNTLLLTNEVTSRNNRLNDIPNSKHTQDVLALRNYLLERSQVKFSDLLIQLADLLVLFNDGKIGYDLDTLLSSLPLLHTGLSVNPDLTDGNFENDTAVDLFSIFDLKITHGWIIEQSDALAPKFNQLKYFDSIQDYIVTNLDDLADIQQWLNNNSTQLTENGRNILNQRLKDHEFVVFFRNNHFSTLYKKDDNDFYVLLTDSSFKNTSKIVWQSLISTTGSDDLFFTGNFTPVLEDTTQDFNEMSLQDEDYQLVKKLQEEDDAEYAKNLQSSFQKKKSTPVKTEAKKPKNSSAKVQKWPKEPSTPKEPSKPKEPEELKEPKEPSRPKEPKKSTKKSGNKMGGCIIV